ncbi:hypothetical protein CVS54_01630 [Microbacterium oxydans]|uniref:Uncharacterized protein n=1 Tax=Microbacterium oxydans TaxID=82380 RepID=A0A3Q9J503_9MICO|nr:hypothetical protein CVS54_01630 [Microbacterium oxydans]
MGRARHRVVGRGHLLGIARTGRAAVVRGGGYDTRAAWPGSPFHGPGPRRSGPRRRVRSRCADTGGGRVIDHGGRGALGSRDLRERGRDRRPRIRCVRRGSRDQEHVRREGATPAGARSRPPARPCGGRHPRGDDGLERRHAREWAQPPHRRQRCELRDRRRRDLLAHGPLRGRPLAARPAVARGPGGFRRAGDSGAERRPGWGDGSGGDADHPVREAERRGGSALSVRNGDTRRGSVAGGDARIRAVGRRLGGR